jgi:N-dimethylarginine dimethylaminohydrolase
LELVDPWYYHLDTAVAVLDATTVAWLPEAFTPASRAVLRDRFPDAVVADRVDAAVLGLNAVSDGRHVVLPAAAARLAAALADRGFVPVPVDCSELLRGGGGPKCCTLEVRA